MTSIKGITRPALSRFCISNLHLCYGGGGKLVILGWWSVWGLDISLSPPSLSPLSLPLLSPLSLFLFGCWVFWRGGGYFWFWHELFTCLVCCLSEDGVGGGELFCPIWENSGFLFDHVHTVYHFIIHFYVSNFKSHMKNLIKHHYI